MIHAMNHGLWSRATFDITKAAVTLHRLEQKLWSRATFDITKALSLVLIDEE